MSCGWCGGDSVRGWNRKTHSEGLSSSAAPSFLQLDLSFHALTPEGDVLRSLSQITSYFRAISVTLTNRNREWSLKGTCSTSEDKQFIWCQYKSYGVLVLTEGLFFNPSFSVGIQSCYSHEWSCDTELGNFVVSGYWNNTAIECTHSLYEDRMYEPESEEDSEKGPGACTLTFHYTHHKLSLTATRLHSFICLLEQNNIRELFWKWEAVITQQSHDHFFSWSPIIQYHAWLSSIMWVFRLPLKLKSHWHAMWASAINCSKFTRTPSV